MLVCIHYNVEVLYPDDIIIYYNIFFSRYSLSFRPDTNSHFGIVDAAGFPKARYYWYQSWFLRPNPPTVFIVPSTWNWNPTVNASVDVWVYSNADSLELFVGGVSQGVKVMQEYSHVEWDSVATGKGNLHVVAYKNGSSVPVNDAWVNATGPASALRLSVKDGAYVGGVDGTMIAGCNDAALLQVEVVDANGALVPEASNPITFTLTGQLVDGVVIQGTANGDPATMENNKSPTHKAYHGLVTAVLTAGDSTGTVTVTASTPGMTSVSIQLPVIQAPAGFSTYWCKNGPRL
jgi:beta-galactosidase